MHDSRDYSCIYTVGCYPFACASCYKKVSEKILVISLVSIFPMGGIAVLILAWASPMPTSDRILSTVVAAIGLSVLPIFLCLRRSFHRRAN